MDQTIQLLAQKLGTTAEFVYAALLRQAPISAATDILQYGIIIGADWLLWKYRDKIAKIDFDEPPQFICGMIVGLILSVLNIAMFFSVGDTVTAILNPDYWAVKQVLAAVKGATK